MEAKNSLTGTWVSDENSTYSVTFSESGFALSNELYEVLKYNYHIKNRQTASAYDVIDGILLIKDDNYEKGTKFPVVKYEINGDTLTSNFYMMELLTSSDHDGLVGRWYYPDTTKYGNQMVPSFVFTKNSWMMIDYHGYVGGECVNRGNNTIVLKNYYSFDDIGIVNLDANGNIESIKLFYSDTSSEEGVVLKKSK